LSNYERKIAAFCGENLVGAKSGRCQGKTSPVRKGRQLHLGAVALKNISYLGTNKTQFNTLKTVEQYRVIKGLDWFKCNIFTGKYPGKIPTEQ
jgi:hypothetical protein